ncbi:hypothetical protein FNV43_RR02634 [Rhamnella rubrinervis]|uniref:Integrator complex subunit 3 N-terminal domain-containing protein n=1 Tax=Rhamnella rubrinervis TaxID=2594499 RepID=A0A8K0MTD3_9ROSA|nr:hypothetical protein FNV43_RR02634 [Rhamnella rubrinervis]
MVSTVLKELKLYDYSMKQRPTRFLPILPLSRLHLVGKKFKEFNGTNIYGFASPSKELECKFKLSIAYAHPYFNLEGFTPSASCADNLLVCLLRQIVGGDFSDGNLWLCFEIGRDLIRLLQDLAHVHELSMWKDLVFNPKVSLGPRDFQIFHAFIAKGRQVGIFYLDYSNGDPVEVFTYTCEVRKLEMPPDMVF